MNDEATSDHEMYGRQYELAEAGAEFMDAIDPKWYWKVNPDTLNMQRSWGECGCVISQHSPGQDYGDRELYGIDLHDAFELGFVSAGGTYAYRILTEAWRDEINDRRWKALARRRQACIPSDEHKRGR